MESGKEERISNTTTHTKKNNNQNSLVLTSVAPPQRLGASRVFDDAEEAGQSVSESAEDRAVSGGGGPGPG